MGSSRSDRGQKKPGGRSASDAVYSEPVQRKATAPGKRTRTAKLPTPESSVVQRKEGNVEASPTAGQSSRAAGALPEATRAKMEESFGADFSGVRVSESSKAEALGAEAYTQGSEIVFAPGTYQPDTGAGQELLGHELTHVVQQSRGDVAPTRQAHGGATINDQPGLERQADEAGARAARGEPAGVETSQGATSGHGVVQRKLKLTGKEAEVNRAVQVMNTNMFGYKASVDKNGYVSLSEVKADGKANAKQKAMYQHLKTIIGDANDTVVKLEGNNKQVIGGSYDLGVVNMDDVELFGTNGGMTSPGVLIHELVEQYQKQVKGKEYGGEGKGAHGTAIVAENEVGGSVRGAQKVISFTDNGDGTYDAVVEVPYTFPDGRVVTTTLKVEKGDLVSATHKETKAAKANADADKKKDGK